MLSACVREVSGAQETVGSSVVGQPANSADGSLESWLARPEFSQQSLFPDGRFPNLLVALDGTVVAVWGQGKLQVRRSTDGGLVWEPPQDLVNGEIIHGGGALVDELTGDLLVFAERGHPPAPALQFRSRDGGQSWESSEPVIRPDPDGRSPSLHMNEHGITLQRGPHRGRLLRPTRDYGESNDRKEWPRHVTNAIFSDDHGQSWQTSGAFPALGTGEAAVVELSDGRLYYNSRRHWAPEGENPRRRWTATSRDGGASWQELDICEALPDGPQDTDYGLMAGLVRLPVTGHDILLFSNVESDQGRHHGTVWASFDGGRSWPIRRLVFEGPFAYSSLAAGRPGTPSAGWLYLLFEGGVAGGGSLARFNLQWVLDGQPTGDGVIPDWVRPDSR